MWHLRLVPDDTHIGFMRWRKLAFALSGTLIVASIVLLLVRGLNFGIDFEGGILMEVKTPKAVDTSALRNQLEGLGLGAIELQQFGAPDDVLIRIERQKAGGTEGDDEAAQVRAVDAVKAAIDSSYGEGVDYRRTEFVGPKVGSELVTAGIEAVLFSLIAMLIYIWFRFEWQFGIGAVLALAHDVTLTIGMYVVTGLEFNLATVAAILLIVGYSMNDTVVVYDRLRENLRKFKKLPLLDIIDRGVNETLARTTMTSFTTLLALIALWLLGGPVIRDFCFAMIWGVVVGTYSSIFVASPILPLFHLDRLARGGDDDTSDAIEAAPADNA